MRIVCFGDSVTRGVSYVKGRLRILKENYPALLQQHAPAEQTVEILNKGVFNDNSDLLLQRVDQDVIALNPEVVLIEIGGNDCNFRWDEVAQSPDEPHEAIVPLERYLSNVRQIVVRIQEAGAMPVLMTTLPLDPVRYYKHIESLHGNAIARWIALCGGIEHWHGWYNRALKQLVSSLQAVMSLDLRTKFKQAGDLKDLLSDDGIHPSALGYQEISRIVAQALWPRQASGNN